MALRRQGLICAALLAWFPAVLPAATNYVSLAGSHAPPFADWDNAATNIQAALDAASAGDTVLVGEGTYTGPGNTDLDFGGKNLALQSTDGPSNTIIECAGQGRGFYFHSGESTSAQVIGFTIQGSEIPGALLIVSNSNPTIEECWILNNLTSPTLSPVTNTISDPEYGLLYLEEVTRSDPEAGSGGGILVEASSPNFNRCLVAGNSAGRAGGGVFITSNSYPRFNECIMSGNGAYTASSRLARIYAYDGSGNMVFATESVNAFGLGGGGAIAGVNSTVHLVRCFIQSNTAFHAGGGLAWESGSLFIEETRIEANDTISCMASTVTTRAYDWDGNMVFHREESFGYDGAKGGGIFASNTLLYAQSCQLSSNAVAGDGGGAYLYAVVAGWTACSIAGNSAQASVHTTVVINAYDEDAQLVYQKRYKDGPATARGGGIAATLSTNTFQNCSISANETDGDGGGLFVQNSDLDLQETQIASNRAAGISSTNVMINAYDDGGNQVYQGRYFDGDGKGRGGGITALDSDVFVQGGYLDGNEASQAGGGLYACSSFATILTARVTGNASEECGGAMYITSNSCVSISSTSVSSNRSGRTSGGITILIMAYDWSGELVFKVRDVYTNATPVGEGGGLFMENSALSVEGVSFFGNEAVAEGGAFFASGGTSRFTACEFIENKALAAGFERSVWINPDAHPPGENCTNVYFLGQGAGLVCASSRVDLVSCVLASNWAGEAAGALLIRSGSVVTVDNSIVMANLSGISRWSTTTVSELTGRYRTQSELLATGIAAACSVEHADLALRHVTLNRNNPSSSPPAVWAFSNASLTAVNTIFGDDGLQVEPDAAAAISYSRVPQPWPGDGNITNDPRMAQTWRLKAASPCLDAAADLPDIPSDIEGEAPWDDPAHPNLYSIRDMGADEFVDTDADGMADLWELEHVINLDLLAGDAWDYDEDEWPDVAEYEWGLNPAAASSDGDWMADGWEIDRGLNPFEQDGDEDPDDDAFVNNEEYIADTDPFDGMDYLHWILGPGGEEGSRPVFSWESRPGRTYRVLVSTNAQAWAEAVETPGTGGWLDFEDDSPAGPARLFSLGVRLTP